MSDKNRYICLYGIPKCVKGSNTVEDLSRYLDTDPHPNYRLVSCNLINGNWHLVFELKENFSEQLLVPIPPPSASLKG